MSEPATLARSTVRLALFAALVGSSVALVAALVGVDGCDSTGTGLASASGCRALVRTLSIRVGLVTGAVTALMSLYVVGLGRMWARDEEDRLAARIEAYRERGR